MTHTPIPRSTSYQASLAFPLTSCHRAQPFLSLGRLCLFSQSCFVFPSTPPFLSPTIFPSSFCFFSLLLLCQFYSAILALKQLSTRPLSLLLPQHIQSLLSQFLQSPNLGAHWFSHSGLSSLPVLFLPSSPFSNYPSSGSSASVYSLLCFFLTFMSPGSLFLAFQSLSLGLGSLLGETLTQGQLTISPSFTETGLQITEAL